MKNSNVQLIKDVLTQTAGYHDGFRVTSRDSRVFATFTNPSAAQTALAAVISIGCVSLTSFRYHGDGGDFELYIL